MVKRQRVEHIMWPTNGVPKSIVDAVLEAHGILIDPELDPLDVALSTPGTVVSPFSNDYLWVKVDGGWTCTVEPLSLREDAKPVAKAIVGSVKRGYYKILFDASKVNA